MPRRKRHINGKPAYSDSRRKGAHPTIKRNHRVFEPLVEEIRRNIMTGILRPGDMIQAELKLADMYNVSRPSVRSGLKELESEGLLEAKPRRGYFVSDNAPVRMDGKRVWHDVSSADLKQGLDNATIPGSGLVRLNAYLLCQFQRAGLLMDILPFVSGLPENPLSGMLPELVRRVVYIESVYALPLGFSPNIAFYNREMLGEHGIDEPREGWTWDDALEIGKRVERRNERGWLLRRWGAPLPWFVYIWQSGGEVLDEANGTYVFDSPAGMEGLELYRRLALSGYCPETNMYGDYQNDEHFLSGRSALCFTSMINYVKLRRAAPFSIGAAPLPRSRVAANWVFFTGLGIRKDSREPEKDWDMLRQLTCREKQLEDYRQGQHYPALASLADELLGDRTHVLDNRLWLDGLRGARFIHYMDDRRMQWLAQNVIRRFDRPEGPPPSLDEIRSALWEANTARVIR